MPTPREDIIDLLKSHPMSTDNLCITLFLKRKLSERIVKESVLKLREEGIVKSNREWKMELVPLKIPDLTPAEVESRILKLLEYEPLDVNAIYQKLSEKEKLTERSVKEAVWKLMEETVIEPNTQWKMTLASKVTADNVD